MSWANIRTQLKTILEGVAGIGTVHDYQRWEIEADNFTTLFVSTGRINTWMITRDASPEDELAQKQHYRKHQIRIIGIYAMDDSDATEKVFSDLLETICNTLRTNLDLAGTAESHSPPEVKEDNHTKFAGVLCHYGEIAMEVREDVTF